MLPEDHISGTLLLFFGPQHSIYYLFDFVINFFIIVVTDMLLFLQEYRLWVYSILV